MVSITMARAMFRGTSFLGIIVCYASVQARELVGCPPATRTGDGQSQLQNTTSFGGDGCDNAATTTSTDYARYDAETFYDTVSYGMAIHADYAFSPDGTSLLIRSDESGVFNAYAQPALGGKPELLTNSTSDAINPLCYFPSDWRILYASDEGGHERYHIYAREEDGTSKDLTPGDDVTSRFLGWHENGMSFWISTNERDASYFDLYQYDDGANGGSYNRTMIFQNDVGLDLADISPDGRWIAFVKLHTSADSDVFLVDLRAENRTEVLITEHEGNVDHIVETFTKDSAQLIYATNEFGEFNQAWTYDLATQQKEVLIEAEWDVEYVRLSRMGRYQVSGINADGQNELTITDTESGEELELPELPTGQLKDVRFNANETAMALMVNSDISPSNVFTISIGTKNSKQLTNALSPLIDQDNLVEGMIVRYPSFDGLLIPSILYKPHAASAANKLPALVWVHGGPGGQSKKGYSSRIQHWVNHNYAVLAVNNRGWSGYGKTFYGMDNKKHGEGDLEDVVYGKTYLVTLEWVDTARIGIAGGSYGGYMTVAALAFKPSVFEVGIDIFGVTNWFRTLNSIPPWWESYRESLYEEMGDPATDEERLRRISPLFHADQITKPLLVVQGARDARVPKAESDEIVAALRQNNVPVEYLVFEDEGHGFHKKSNRIAAAETYISFLDRYLTTKEAVDAKPREADATLGDDSSGSTMFFFGSWVCLLASWLIFVVALI